MRVWFAVIGFVLGAAAGVAAGFALEDSTDVEAQTRADAAAVPEACLEAISAARDRLLLNPDVAQTLRDYRTLGEELGTQVSDLRVPDLRETLGRLNDLNDRSAELIDRSVNARFSATADECEEIASERRRATPPE